MGLSPRRPPRCLWQPARRLRLVVLVHMPLGHRPARDHADEVRAREHEVLAAACAVVTTSAWARRRLLELYPLAADRVHVAAPGVCAGRRASAKRDPAGGRCCAWRR